MNLLVNMMSTSTGLTADASFMASDRRIPLAHEVLKGSQGLETSRRIQEMSENAARNS